MDDITTRAIEWAGGRGTGASSKAIWSHMLTGKCDGSYPRDGDDLGRCVRLLDLIPEWKSRIGEMARYGGAWIGLVDQWDALVKLHAAEKHDDLYKAMRLAHAAGYKADPEYDCTFNKDGTISSWKKKGGRQGFTLGKGVSISFGR